jgi:hypothetical protein
MVMRKKIRHYDIDLAVHKAAKRLGVEPWHRGFNAKLNPADFAEALADAGISPPRPLSGKLRTKRADYPYIVVPDPSIPEGSVEVEFI